MHSELIVKTISTHFPLHEQAAILIGKTFLLFVLYLRQLGNMMAEIMSEYLSKSPTKKRGFWETVVSALKDTSRGTSFFVTLFGASLVIRLTREFIVFTKSSNLSM